MLRAYVNLPEGQVHYRTEGKGEPLLLFHMACRSSDQYTRVIPFLSKTYWVIAMDFLGYGDSDKPSRQYSVADHARTAIKFMDALGIKKAYLGGHHTGGVVSAEIAITYPDRVKKIIMSAPAYFATEQARIDNRDSPMWKRVEIQANGAHLKEWWRRAAWYGDPPEIVQENLVEFVKAGTRGEEMHWAMHEYDFDSRFPLIKCPTLLMSGDRDHLYLGLDGVAKLIPGHKMTIIEGGDCYYDRMMPKQFAEAILNFLKE